MSTSTKKQSPVETVLEESSTPNIDACLAETAKHSKLSAALKATADRSTFVADPFRRSQRGYAKRLPPKYAAHILCYACDDPSCELLCRNSCK
jgi:hypothetical protein